MADTIHEVPALPRSDGGLTRVDPKEIFELIIKADEKLKYATDANRETREHQAKELLLQALEAAREAGNAALVAQTEQRLTDLGMPPVAGAAGTTVPA